MAQDIEEQDRSLVGSLVSSYTGMWTNPIQASLYGTWSNLSEGRFLAWPGFIPNGRGNVSSYAIKGARKLGQLGWNALPGYVEESWNTKNWAINNKFMKGLLFGDFMEFGSANAEVQAIETMAQRRDVYIKNINKLKGMKNRKGLSNWTIKKSEAWARRNESVIGDRLINTLEKQYTSSFMGKFSWWAKGLGTVMAPIMDLAAIYSTSKWIVTKGMHGFEAAANAMNNARTIAASLELGGTMNANYSSTQASTERQRALQAIQSSHLSGRRWLGSEASFYH